MGTSTFSNSFSNSTDALFRSWGKAFTDALDAAGFTRAADTGQVNWATVTAPLASNTVAGYAIYYLNDSLHATAPVYVRFEFGTGFFSGGVAYPRVNVIVGKSTNGAGVLAGILLPSTSISGTITASGVETLTTYAGYATAGAGYAALIPFVDDSSVALRPMFFMIERSRDTTGGISAAGLLIGYCSAIGSTPSLITTADKPTIRTVSYVSAAYIEQVPPVSLPYSINGVILGPSASLAAGGIGPVFPWVVMAPGVAPWQSCVFVTIPAGDYPASDFTAVLCGRSSIFRPVPVTPNHVFGMAVAPSATAGTVAGQGALAIRWEA